MPAETREVRLKRMTMRSMRRGIKEMDIILRAFAADRLATMDPAALDLYDALLAENDHDLYQWVTGRAAAPAPLAGLIAEISAYARRG